MNRKIYFQNSEGHKLCGILSDPSGDMNRSMIVLSHGLSTSKDGRTCVRLEAILNRLAFSTFRFDFFGHGESEGIFANITISEAVDDVQCAIRFVKDAGYKRIGLVGSSFGGMASILTAGQSEGLFALALKSPVSDYLALLIARNHGQDIDAWRQAGYILVETPDEKKERLNYSFLADAEKTRGYAFAANIKAPTLIVHGDRDEIVPLAQSLKIAELIPDCRLEVIRGADHVYSDPEHFEIMLKLISDFIIDKGDLES
jgi:pimeloyl-ACP methyl ester carboxylesterase